MCFFILHTQESYIIKIHHAFVVMIHNSVSLATVWHHVAPPSVAVWHHEAPPSARGTALSIISSDSCVVLFLVYLYSNVFVEYGFYFIE